MNAAQRQNVINQIVTFKSLDLETIFATKLGNDAQPENTSAGDYSVIEIFSLSRQVVSQLEERINTSNLWQMLPATQNFNNDFGQCDLNGQLSTLSTYLGRGDYTNSVPSLKSLIYYQIINGFWDKPRRIEVGVRMKTLEIIENKINLLESHLNERRTQLERLLTDATEVKTNLDSFVQEETQKFEALTINTKESETKLTVIQTHLEETGTELSKIKTIETECVKLKSAIELIQTNTTAKQTEINSAYDTFVKSSTETFDNAIDRLEQIDKDYNYVEGKKEEVRKMMGYIADGTLSHSFNSRKTKIQTSVWVWLVASILSAIFMATWIFIVFTCLKAETGNPLADIFINVAKTSPMIVLFWFSLNQYQKERNLLEEYAFREAMAITLTAYLDQLHGEEDENKRGLLLGTVEKLYTKPRISSEGVGLFSFKSKDLVELVKEVKDVLVEVKSKK